MSRARDLANGTISGAFSADSPTLVVDATNNAVGVGNADPQRQFHIGASDNTNHDAVIVLNNGGATGYRAGIEWRYESNTTPRARISVNASDLILRFDTNNTERMAIDSAGRVTMPYQPYFGAFKSGGLDTGTGVLVFDSVLNNTGGHYNNTNGRFTAPVNGVYAFTCQVFWLGSGSDVVARCDWRFNGAIRSEGKYGLIATQDYQQQQTTFMRYMAAGDYLDLNVSVNPAGFLCGSDNFTWLYGFLLG